MSSEKIVLIGAGSVEFTQGLVADLIAAPELGPWELALVDVDPDALEAAAGLSRRMVEAKGAAIEVAVSTDRRDLLPGAAVVVTTIGVGGRRSWEADVYVPRKYGVFQPVGDTVMPGGISRAMRMIPALVGVARDVADLCASAWFFNYSNPMTANCRAIRKATGAPVVGLCHGTFQVERQLAAFAGARPEDVTSLFAGLNHLTFIFDLRERGVDLWPRVRERVARERAEGREEMPGAPLREMGVSERPFTVGQNPLSWELFETLGAYPAVNDRHVVEFFPERFPEGRYHGRTLGVDAYPFDLVIAHGDRRFAEMRARALGETPLDEAVFSRAEGEHEQLLDILRSLRNDGRRVFPVNVPNRGAVPSLPAEAVLELPAAATSTALRPLQLPDFPDALAPLLVRRIAAVELTVEAALSGDRGLLVEALLADGAVTDAETARVLSEELLEVQRPHLPQFF